MYNLYIMVFLYVSLFIVANLLVASFGPWITPFNALFIISADMVIRDRIQFNNGFFWSVSSCFVAGLSTVIINPDAGMIAIASMSSVIMAGVGSAIIFKFKSGCFYRKAFPANVAAAAIDSVAFPIIAFGHLMIDVTIVQFLAKTIGAIIILLIMRRFIK